MPGTPKGKGRPRFVKATGHVYTPQGTKDYEQLIAVTYKNAYPGETPMDGPVHLTVLAQFAQPKGTSKARTNHQAGMPYTKKSDLDNIVKVVLDALNGLAFADDKQVTRITAHKRYCKNGETARVVVGLEKDERKPR